MANSKWQIVSKISKGFTLIELLVVFSVLGILSTASVVSFVSYNENQTMTNAAKDISQMILHAKSRAQSQVKPPECEGSLQGYEVSICSIPGECVESGGNYEMVAVCTSNRTLIDPRSNTTPKTLPDNVVFDPALSPPTKIFFQVLNGGVTGNGVISLSGFGQTKNITIDASGNVY